MSATNRGSERHARDFYETPVWSVQEFARRYPGKFDRKHVLDAGAGTGVIGYTLASRYPGVRITSIDLEPQCFGIKGDFLTHAFVDHFDAVIMNPPYNLADQFIRRAGELSPFVAALLRLNWLEARSRPWLSECMPDVHVLSPRPSFTGGGNDACAYAWMVWDRNRDRPAQIDILRRAA